MTRTSLLLLLPLGIGCRSFETVDDACKGSIRGERHGSAEANDFFGRVTCYRRLAGLPQANIRKEVSEAAEAHAAYLAQNGIGPDWPNETIGLPGFTGQTSFDRIEAAGFPVDVAATFLWEVLVPTDVDVPRGEVVDGYMHDPLVRDVLLAPGWLGGGYAELDAPDGRWAYFHAVLSLPSNANANRPIVYPADGQLDVPISVSGGGLTGAAPLTGYPITLTFGSTSSDPNLPNPLGVTVIASVITGPSGPVAHTVYLPATYDGWGRNYSTAILLPTDPLEPNATYTVGAEVSWVSDPSKKLEWTFTTGEAPATAGF